MNPDSERKISNINPEIVRRVWELISTPGNEQMPTAKIGAWLGISASTAGFAMRRLYRDGIVERGAHRPGSNVIVKRCETTQPTVAEFQRHPKPEDYPERFAHFEPGCIVFWRNQRWRFVIFEQRAAVLYCEVTGESAVAFADEIEFISPPTEDARAFALSRTPRKKVSWRDRGMGLWWGDYEQELTK